ncbi:MAG TPA: GNAT family N-acetyltransferase [Candidatus Sulfotelmatobacter sp.]|nr:GNAT family N-acetyltransferase [Candidatus Sulfotelmatobacter sp.]
MPALRLARFARAGDLLALAGDFLAGREAEHNLILGILGGLRSPAPDTVGGPPYLAAAVRGDTVVAVAVRTPPWNLVLSEVDDEAALPLVARDVAVDLAERGPDASIRGVLGPVREAEAFARSWVRRSGQRMRLARTERIFRLDRVRRPRPAGGTWRLATTADRGLLVAWLNAFNDEALQGDEPVDMAVIADRMLAGGGRAAYLWDDEGPVSLTAIGGRTAHGVRVGPVYTPPERRGRGYASSLVAAVSQAQLDAGCRSLFLFTDLANPTSNHIYRAIGYEPVRDVADWRFEPAGRAA